MFKNKDTLVSHGGRLTAAQFGCALQQAHREGSEREREISAVQAKASADNLTYRWKALCYGLFLKSNNSCGFFKP